MNKSLVVKIIILLLVLVGGQGIFWFFKTSAAKKHITSVVNASDGNISVGSVAVAGFPFFQKIAVDDIKFQADAVADKIYLPNKYQVNIKHLEISGSVFSNQFKARIIGQVSLQDVSGNVGYVEFKQEPTINFTFNSGQIQKLFYSDAGYKIVDESKNVLYEGGNSSVEFNSVKAEGNKIINNIRADFSDIEGLDIFTTKKIMFLINPTAAEVVNEEGLKTANSANAISGATTDGVAPATIPSVPANATTAPEVAAAPTNPAVSNGLTKKAIHLEIEYVMAPKAEEAGKKDATPEGNLELLSANIKNLEFSSPLYKINVNGNFTAAPSSASAAIANCNIIVKIEKIENILTYLKTALASSKALLAGTPTISNAVNPAVAASPAVSSILPQNATTANIASAQQPDADISVVFMDLAKKNASTNEITSVFEIKKDQEGDFAINGTPLSDLAKIFPAFADDIVNENN